MSTILTLLFIGHSALVATPSPSTTATATLTGKSGSDVLGKVDFKESAAGLDVTYRIEGLEKNSRHGFHIHEKGDCSSADAKSAGPHYAPIAKTGGTSIDSPQKHAGDLPEINADETGVAAGTFSIPRLSVDEKLGIENRSIVVHGGPDDPTKKSPPRIACGVIKGGTIQ